MKQNRTAVVSICILLPLLVGILTSPSFAGQDSDLIFINTTFENACPLHWDIGSDGSVHIYLVYDHERASPNRANGHWHFEIQAKPNVRLTLILHNFENIYNGRRSSPTRSGTLCFVSPDARTWRPIPTELTDDKGLKLTVSTGDGSLFVARLPPYRLSDLQRLLERISREPLVKITRIGETVEGRDLEIVRIGHANGSMPLIGNRRPTTRATRRPAATWKDTVSISCPWPTRTVSFAVAHDSISWGPTSTASGTNPQTLSLRRRTPRWRGG